VEALMLPAPLGSSDQDGALQAVAQSAVVILGTLRADQDATQAALVQAMLARGQRVIVVALRTPYDLLAFPQVETYLCAYGIRPVTIEAVARVLMGEIPAWGVLPCPIPGLVTPLR
jgi:beta-N-acetylhexosaminidase